MTLPDDHDARMARAHLALEGLSLGDGFGERFFGKPEWVVPMIEQRALPAGPWAWTDDTAMTIGITEVLQRHGGIDADDLAGVFARRYGQDPGRGYGRGTHAILGEVRAGAQWRGVSGAVFGGTGSLGNGAAMRIAPLGAYFADDLDALVEHAQRSAEPTHAHPDGAAGGVAVAVASALVHRERPSGPVEAEQLLPAVIERTPEGPTRDGLELAQGLGLGCELATAAEKLGTGRMVVSADTVPFCVWSAARNLGHYERAMWQTVAGLGNRDTTCAIVGGILAGNVGAAGLPAEWLETREALPSPIDAPFLDRARGAP